MVSLVNKQASRTLPKKSLFSDTISLWNSHNGWALWEERVLPRNVSAPRNTRRRYMAVME